MGLEQPTLKYVSSTMKDLSRVLIESGCSSSRVENLISKIARQVGYEVEMMATPTAAWISLKSDYEQIVELVRVKVWHFDLSLLSELNIIINKFLDGDISFVELTQGINYLNSKKAPYSARQLILATGLASGCLMSLLGGEGIAIIAAFFVGIFSRSLTEFLDIREERRYLSDFLTAFSVALISTMLSRFFEIESADVPKLITSGIILLLPGLVFVNAIHELAQKNLVSGSAKIMEAGMIGLSLAFGVGMCFGFLEFF